MPVLRESFSLESGDAELVLLAEFAWADSRDRAELLVEILWIRDADS